MTNLLSENEKSAKELSPLTSFDAQVWAESFIEHVRHNPTIATDIDCMRGWFANALMRGFDEHAQRMRRIDRPNLLEEVVLGIEQNG